MFSLFKKSDALKYSDKIWKTRDAMLKGLATEGAQIILTHGKPLLISWFDDKHQSLIDFLTKSSIPFEVIEGNSSLDRNSVYVTHAEALRSMTLTAKHKLFFLFDGHYPLLQKEDDVMEKLKTLNRENTQITFYQSLDGPLLKKFGGDRMTALLDQMGLKDDECLEHAMITSSITNARQKLSKEITNEMTSRKESDWFLKNAGY